MCRSQVDERERLHCYDAAVDGASAAAAVPDAAVPSTSSAKRRPGEPASPAMMPAASAPLAAKVAAPTPTATMFTAKVVALSFRPSGAVNVTLDNGQVWTQYGPEGRVPLKAGDTVILRPGLFGASVLVGPSGWITKVHPIPATPAAP
jgi:hypothetical protein